MIRSLCFGVALLAATPAMSQQPASSWMYYGGSPPRGINLNERFAASTQMASQAQPQRSILAPTAAYAASATGIPVRQFVNVNVIGSELNGSVIHVGNSRGSHYDARYRRSLIERLSIR